MPQTSGWISLSTVLVLLALTWNGWAQESQPAPPRPVPTVRDIAVEGNRRIQSPAILNRIQTKIGDSLAPAALRDDVRSIFGLGFFDDVQVRTEEFEGGVRVIFVVVERPLLREVSFEGNSELTTEELREKATIRVGVLYNPVEVQTAEEAIRQQYEDEGFFGVQITPRTERTPEGDLRVVFRIEEGPKLHIDRILIEGNKALTASQIKDVMQTRERLYWIFPFSTVQRRVFDDDVDRILQLYGDYGYIQARVESTEIVPDLARKKVTLRVRVVEGPQFTTGSITITGNELLSTEEIRRMVKLQEGGVFNRGALRTSVRAIVDRYSELGRARAEVDPRTVNDLANLKVDVTIPITEGGPVYVERINITGNTKSSEKVLRRELRVAEGELFTFQKLVRSRQRLFNLGYFDEVNATTEPGSTPDRIVVNIDVKERATGLFSIGAGYSSLDSLFATVDVSQRNLFGRGQEAFLRFRIGSQSRLGLVGFTEPYLFDIPLRAGFDVYDREREYDDFTEERLGGDIRAAYPLTEYLTISGLYRLEDVTVSDVSEFASEDLKKEEGSKLNSVVESALTRDTRDSIFEPTRGSRNSIEFSFAGLGGDTQFYKFVTESAWFVPLPVFNLVWAVRGLFGMAEGWGGQEVPIFERFFLGGATTLRGQGTREVSPRDAAGERIGGDKELLFNTELLIPIFPRFRLAFFFDAGNAYGFGTDFDPTDLRLGAGVGVRFFSPLGPMRLDFGYNLDRQPGEKDYQINFTVGSPF
ncbi:MAG TPA: outer membrane protein assembly factor BamA [Methylomirabilota bacterium]|jgi:outer membrane protein insertion porin family|nr:outer membrane protein assembly factor BamA [Methylomirabilota bacterium]